MVFFVLSERMRLTDIDSAKGLIIPLVVFTHIVLRGDPEGNDWYAALRAAIVAFDMPIFMYLSGIVMFYSRAAMTPPEKYLGYLKKRSVRFLLPYTIMGLLVLLGKTIASGFIFVDNAPPGLGQGIRALFWNTGDSPAQSMWYIFVIYVYCLFLPPLLWLTKGRVWPLMVLGIVMYPLPWPELVFLNKIGHFFIFFMLGGMASVYLSSWQVFIDRWRSIFIVLFVCSFSLFAVDMHWLTRMAVIGAISLPALHALARMQPLLNSKLLMTLGAYCYAIYLFNTLFIGLVKGVLFHFMSWDGPNFLVFAPVLFLSGIAGPMLLKYFVFRKFRALDVMTS